MKVHCWIFHIESCDVTNYRNDLGMFTPTTATDVALGLASWDDVRWFTRQTLSRLKDRAGGLAY